VRQAALCGLADVAMAEEHAAVEEEVIAQRGGQLGLRHGGDRKGSLNEGRIPHFRDVRVHASTGYNRVERNRRAPRNGRGERSPTRYDSPLSHRCRASL
jgi:hypothetical protein